MVGGAGAAPPGIARAVVLIVGSRGNSCSGVALARELVLTAAHCVLPGADYKIVEYDAARQPQLRDVTSVTAHPKFDIKTMLAHRATADVALLKLAAPLAVTPAALGGAGFTVAPGDAFSSRAPASRRAATASPAERCVPPTWSRPGGPGTCRSAFMMPRPKARKQASAPAPGTAADRCSASERRARGRRRGQLVDRAGQRRRLRRPHRRDAAHALSRLDHTLRKNTWEPNLILRLRA